MNIIFSGINISELDLYTKLFIEVFNKEPWNDNWTTETASKRLNQFINVETFDGLSLWNDGNLVGVIMGRSEQYYDGVYFQIQEFYVDNNVQGKGYGTLLLNEFEDRLKKKGVVNINLITIRNIKTEGFYVKKGYTVDNNMCFMNKFICKKK